MFAKFKDAYGTSPMLKKDKVYYLRFWNIGYEGALRVTMPQSDNKKYQTWAGIYVDYNDFLNDWEVI